jgi:hypothetical protein
MALIAWSPFLLFAMRPAMSRYRESMFVFIGRSRARLGWGIIRNNGVHPDWS